MALRGIGCVVPKSVAKPAVAYLRARTVRCGDCRGGEVPLAQDALAVQDGEEARAAHDGAAGGRCRCRLRHRGGPFPKAVEAPRRNAKCRGTKRDLAGVTARRRNGGNPESRPGRRPVIRVSGRGPGRSRGSMRCSWAVSTTAVNRSPGRGVQAGGRSAPTTSAPRDGGEDEGFRAERLHDLHWEREAPPRFDPFAGSLHREVLRPETDLDVLADLPGQGVRRGAAGSRPGRPPTWRLSAPFSATSRAGRKFIFGAPMKPATKRSTGLR